MLSGSNRKARLKIEFLFREASELMFYHHLVLLLEMIILSIMKSGVTQIGAMLEWSRISRVYSAPIA